ncbi:MAG: DNA primase [Flavobacteriaceae bacterium]
MISKSTIDQVYETARVEEVIGDFVALKKSGSNYKGLSPFSQERTPSFMVSPVKQIWKDFSSGKGGNVVAFLMEHEHFSYPEAIRYLAKKYNIEIEETQQSDAEKEQRSQQESMYLVAQYAATFYQEQLWDTQEGKSIGLSYFQERGFTEQTIKAFGLGYAPESKTALTEAAQSKGYSLDFLEATGLSLVNEAQGPPIDRFRARVMFPIRSMSGRIQGFGGRILSSKTKVAKYLNSPESPIYHKSKVLYGLFESKKAIAKEDCCYLVEGYTDVLQMHQSGIENVVASSGTALTAEQIRLIRRLTNQIVVLFDGDAAGLRASLRGIDLILEEGMHVKVCAFPEGEDPDSFCKNRSKEAIEEYLQEEAKDFIQFKASLLVADAADDPAQKAQTIREIVTSISKIPDGIQRELYVQRCASLLGVSEGVLFSALAQLLHQKDKPTSRRPQSTPQMQVVPPPVAPTKINRAYELERQIIALLLQYGSAEVEFEEVFLQKNDQGALAETAQKISSKVYEKIFLDLQQDEIEFADPNFKSLYYSLIQTYQKEEKVQPERLMQSDDMQFNQVISDILMQDENHRLDRWDRKNIFVKPKEKELARMVTETILSLRRHLIDQKIHELQKQTQEEAAILDHSEQLEEIKSYLTLRTLVSKRLDRVL